MVITLAVLAVVLPFLSVGIGAWITYRLNVRDRARTRIEDILHDAIAAVAVAAATFNYVSGAAPWRGATEAEWAEFVAALNREGYGRHLRAVADARSALARASAYEPTLRRFYEGTGLLDVSQADLIIDQLRNAIDSRTGG